MMGKEDPWLVDVDNLYSQDDIILHERFLRYSKTYEITENDKESLKNCLICAMNIPKGRRMFVEKQIGIIKYAFGKDATNIILEVLYNSNERVTRSDRRWVEDFVRDIKVGDPKNFVKDFKSLNKKKNNFKNYFNNSE